MSILQIRVFIAGIADAFESSVAVGEVREVAGGKIIS